MEQTRRSYRCRLGAPCCPHWETAARYPPGAGHTAQRRWRRRAGRAVTLCRFDDSVYHPEYPLVIGGGSGTAAVVMPVWSDFASLTGAAFLVCRSTHRPNTVHWAICFPPSTKTQHKVYTSFLGSPTQLARIRWRPFIFHPPPAAHPPPLSCFRYRKPFQLTRRDRLYRSGDGADGARCQHNG